MRALAALILFSLPAWAGVTWCQPIVIQHGKVANTDQNNYVLTINDTDPHMATVTNGGYVQNTSGNDIIFSSDSHGLNLLNWDPLEVYNPATGQMVTHVAVGTVSHTVDTTIYRCAGNSSAVFQGGATGAVWPSAYRLVEHFAGGSAPDDSDATANGNNGTSTGTSVTTGIIGGAVALNGTADYVGAASSTTLSVTGQLTISVWVKLNALPSSYTEIVRKGSPYFLFCDANPSLGLAIDGDYQVATNYLIPGSAVGNWSQIVATYDSSTAAVKLYWNGMLVTNRTTSNTLTTDTTPLSLGGLSGGAGQFLNGALDEVRISSVALSADRIATDYNNQSNPSAFYIPGAWSATQVTRAGGSQSLIF